MGLWHAWLQCDMQCAKTGCRVSLQRFEHAAEQTAAHPRKSSLSQPKLALSGSQRSRPVSLCLALQLGPREPS